MNIILKNSAKAFVAVAATMLASCASDDFVNLDNSTDNNEIAFSTYIKSSSRANAIANDSTIKANGIRVSAYKHSGNFAGSTEKSNFMQNVELKYSNNAWSYSPVQFWPTDGDYLTFFAYAPFSKVNDGGTSHTYSILDKNNKIATANVYDLITAKSADLNRSNTNKVSFSLGHATARIDIKMRLKEVFSGTDVYITDVEFAGNKFYTSGTYDMFSNKWTNTTAAGTDNFYSLSSFLDYDKDQTAITGSGLKITNSKKENNYTGIFKNQSYGISKKDFFFGIPNDDDDTAQREDHLLRITYALVTTGVNGTNISYGYQQTFDLKTVFKQGNAYSLNFTIDIAGNAVQFDGASVVAWNDVDSENNKVEQDTDSSTGNTIPDSEQNNQEQETYTDYFIYGNGTGLGWSTSDANKLSYSKENAAYYISFTNMKGEFMIGTSKESSDLYGYLHTATDKTHITSVEIDTKYIISKGDGNAINKAQTELSNVTLWFQPTSDLDEDNRATANFWITKNN